MIVSISLSLLACYITLLYQQSCRLFQPRNEVFLLIMETIEEKAILNVEKGFIEIASSKFLNIYFEYKKCGKTFQKSAPVLKHHIEPEVNSIL